jgi:hypothetical protein
MREIFSAYGMCFNLAVMINHKLAEQARYEGRIPFILDDGNSYIEHRLRAHAAMMEFQKSDYIHAGCLNIEDDANSALLQAADVIAWGVRRQESQKAFPPGLEQIAELLLKKQAHHNNEWKSEWLKQLGDWARTKIEPKGTEIFGLIIGREKKHRRRPKAFRCKPPHLR